MSGCSVAEKVSRIVGVRVPYAMASASLVRHELRSDLTAHSVPAPVVDDAVSIVSELLSNALRHAAPLPDGSVRVGWELGSGVLSVSVTDGGSDRLPALRAAAALDTGGRGLSIVSSLADEWGVEQAPAATTVWAQLSVKPERKPVLC